MRVSSFMTEPLFYRNCVGAVALSVDDGETVWIPQGRNIPLTPAWKWTDEDGLEACLNDVQTKALEHARNAPPLSDLEQIPIDTGEAANVSLKPAPHGSKLEQEGGELRLQNRLLPLPSGHQCS